MPARVHNLAAFCRIMLPRWRYMEGDIYMDGCRSCGGTLDDCNESQVVCPWCGEADCWLRLDHLIDMNLDDFDLDSEQGPAVDS